MERFTELKLKRKSLSEMTWTATHPPVRLFLPDDGHRTHEHTISNLDLALIIDACGVTENEGGPAISYCAAYGLGNAVKAAVLRHLDKQLLRLAGEARAEAEAVLDELSIRPAKSD